MRCMGCGDSANNVYMAADASVIARLCDRCSDKYPLAILVSLVDESCMNCHVVAKCCRTKVDKREI